MRRLMIVYNPRSSRYKEVQAEVLGPARELSGVMVGKYEVKPGLVDDNAAALAEILRDGDLVVAVGGDGTATIGVNGVMLSGKDVAFGVVGYGNFNDLARNLGGLDFKEIVERGFMGETKELWPLEVLVDGKHWRYAACYVTVGMFAESTAIFDEEKVRERLQKRGGGSVYSVAELAKWYFKNRKAEFLGEGAKLDGQELATTTTDYMAVNGVSMARWMRGEADFWEREKFWSGVATLKGVFGLGWFMFRSIVARVPGRRTEGDVLEFRAPARVMIQAEGEYRKFSGVRRIEVRKAKRGVKVVGAEK